MSQRRLVQGAVALAAALTVSTLQNLSEGDLFAVAAYATAAVATGLAAAALPHGTTDGWRRSGRGFLVASAALLVRVSEALVAGIVTAGIVLFLGWVASQALLGWGALVLSRDADRPAMKGWRRMRAGAWLLTLSFVGFIALAVSRSSVEPVSALQWACALVGGVLLLAGTRRAIAGGGAAAMADR